MVVTHTHAKDQDQKSLGSKVGMETDGRTNRGDCSISGVNAVGKIKFKLQLFHTYYCLLLGGQATRYVLSRISSCTDLTQASYWKRLSM